MVRRVFRRGVWIHNFSLFLVFFQYFFAEIEFSFSFYLQVNIKFHVKFARQSLLWASGKVMCFSKYTGTGIKNHLPKLGNKRWKLPLCDCVRTLENWTSHSFYFTWGGTIVFLVSLSLCELVRLLENWTSYSFYFTWGGHSCLLGLSVFVWVSQTTGKLDLLQFLFYLRGHSCLLGLSWLAFILKVWVHELAWCDWVVIFWENPSLSLCVFSKRGTSSQFACAAFPPTSLHTVAFLKYMYCISFLKDHKVKWLWLHKLYIMFQLLKQTLTHTNTQCHH